MVFPREARPPPPSRSLSETSPGIRGSFVGETGELDLEHRLTCARAPFEDPKDDGGPIKRTSAAVACSRLCCWPGESSSSTTTSPMAPARGAEPLGIGTCETLPLPPVRPANSRSFTLADGFAVGCCRFWTSRACTRMPSHAATVRARSARRAAASERLGHERRPAPHGVGLCGEET